jgi:ankyrin repeat protein
MAIVEYLLAHGAGSERTIAVASEWERTEVVQKLLEAGITPERALSKASEGGYLDIVRLLLDAGVDLEKDAVSTSALANAIASEHTEMFNLQLNERQIFRWEG